jgi:hypothetical protein
MKDDDLMSRLWSGGAKESRPPSPSEQGRADDKVVPLHPPAQRGQEFSPVFPADRVYQAFETSDRAERLHIVRAVGMALRPAHHSLTDMREDVFHQSCFTLIYYPFLTVEVYGANLGPVMHAIAMGKCERIREFHRDLYDYPAKDQPFIESIRITATTDEPDTIPIANHPPSR